MPVRKRRELFCLYYCFLSVVVCVRVCVVAASSFFFAYSVRSPPRFFSCESFPLFRAPASILFEGSQGIFSAPTGWTSFEADYALCRVAASPGLPIDPSPAPAPPSFPPFFFLRLAPCCGYGVWLCSFSY